MAPSDDFKAQLKAGNINEALSLALNGAVDLKITTWVTSATDTQQTSATKPGHRLRTRINTIEGKIDNEIGDQFINNGPYRELRQFHLDQVNLGNEIIHSNLKSLQTLFEVVIAMQSARRRIAALPLPSVPFVLEPEASDEQLLPPAPDLAQTDDTLLTPNAVVEELAIAPDSLTENVVELTPAPNSLAENVAVPAVLAAGVAATFLSVPVATTEELEDEDEDDDWDDSVLDLLESLPVGEPSELEALDASEEEDWRNLIEEDDAPVPPELDSPITTDWGILTKEDFDPPKTATEASPEPLDFQEDLGELIKDDPHPATHDALAEQDWGKLSFEDLQSPPAAAIIPETLIPEEEDWGDLIEDEPPLLANKPLLSLESLNLEDEEWDDWVIESESLQASPISRLESLDLADNDGWDDFGEDVDPFAAAPINSALSLEDADWDNFSVDELESYTGLLDLETNVGAGFDLSGDFEDLTVAPPTENQQSYRSQQLEINKPSAKDASDLMDVLFGDEPQPLDSDAAHPDNGMDKTEEELFADMRFEEFLANGDSASEPQLKQDAEADKTLPPPPPPRSHFPNQNNQTSGG